MKYDVQQLNELISNLELDIEKVTESERNLKDFFNFNSSYDYYIEHIDVLNSMLDCCVELDEEKFEVNKNFDKVYELLRNDLYKYKSKEIKKKNIQFDQIDQLEFFNFLNKLYNDPDFIERHSQKDNELLSQVKEIRNKLESILKYQIQEYFKNTEIDSERIKDFNFSSKQELYDEAYNRLMQLDLSSCLKNIYYKDAIFTIKDDLKLIHRFKNTEFNQDFVFKLKKYLKKYFNTDLDLQKDKRLVFELLGVLAWSGVSGIFSTAASDATKALEFLKVFGISFGKATFMSSGAVVFAEALLRRFENQDENVSNTADVIKQKYDQLENEMFYNEALKLKYNIEKDKKDIEEDKKEKTQLEDSAFYDASIQIRYNSDVIEQLKKVIRAIEDKTLDEHQFNELLNDCKPVQAILEQLDQQVSQLQKKKKSELRSRARFAASYAMSEQQNETYEQFLEVFKKFSQENQDKLFHVVLTSKEKTDLIKEFIKTSLLFNKDLSTIQTFEDLMKRVLEHSKNRQNQAQSYLQRMLNDAEEAMHSNQLHQTAKSVR